MYFTAGFNVIQWWYGTIYKKRHENGKVGEWLSV